MTQIILDSQDIPIDGPVGNIRSLAIQPQTTKAQVLANNVENEISAAAAAAGEIVSPEEALPEEMIPDQESPAFQPPAIKTESQQASSPVPENFPHQQEHAQQQESLKIDEHNDLVHASIIPSNTSPVRSDKFNVQADNFSRSLLNLESKLSDSNPVFHSNLRTAKIKDAHIDSLRESVRMNSVSYEQSRQKTKVGREEENLPVLTRTLYNAGHYLPPKDVCPEQGEGMKLMILVTTAPGHAAQREAVRSTWGHVAFRRDVGLAFMVGTSKNHSENMLVERENIIYGDIIQVNIYIPYRIFSSRMSLFINLEFYNVLCKTPKRRYQPSAAYCKI